MSQLDDLLDHFTKVPEKDQKAMLRDVSAKFKGRRWFPNPGPQTTAYFCKADELFYGGQAGGGKSALVCGLSVEQHERSLILRRINKDAKKLAEAELLGRIFDGDRNGWNGSDLIYRDGANVIEFSGCENEQDKQRFKGDPHDLIAFDEISDFLESQYVFIKNWNRSTTPDQRCRVVCTGNPPTTAEGLWVIDRWAPWLDDTHPNPAEPGELRWFISDEEGLDTEVDGPGPHKVGDREVLARSRTFIPAELGDNPDLDDDGVYGSLLDSLPKELRDAYRDGRFDRGLKDNPWQVIPTQWVIAAQDRWTEYPPANVPMCSIGLDVAQGGDDDNVMAMRYDGWYAPLERIAGKDTPLGVSQAGLVITHRKGDCPVIIDCDGGYGGTAYKDLKDNGVTVVAYKGSEGSKTRTKDRILSFTNKRTETYWKFREALDPDQPGGSPIMLPPGKRLLSDLTAATYEVRKGVIYVEAKKDIKKRLGRSTDDGDAVTMAWTDGGKTASHYQQWHEGRRSMGAAPKVNYGHAGRKRR